MGMKAMRGIALAAAALATAFGAGAPAEAAITILAQETGGDVVFTGSGTADLTDLTLQVPTDGNFASAQVIAIAGRAYVGSGSASRYFGPSGPSSFGGGSLQGPTDYSGDIFGINNSPPLVVPYGYVSGASLSGSATYSGNTFASLGMTPGTYVWTWGTGAHVDSLTLQIGPAVPEPGAWALTLAGFTALAAAGARLRRRARAL